MTQAHMGTNKYDNASWIEGFLTSKEAIGTLNVLEILVDHKYKSVGQTKLKMSCYWVFKQNNNPDYEA